MGLLDDFNYTAQPQGGGLLDFLRALGQQPGTGESDPTGQFTRRDAITDEGLTHFTDAYPGEAITKDDVFYYVYGLLHSEEYRERFADNLTKQLPRIPLMKRFEGFRKRN